MFEWQFHGLPQKEIHNTKTKKKKNKKSNAPQRIKGRETNNFFLEHVNYSKLKIMRNEKKIKRESAKYIKEQANKKENAMAIEKSKVIVITKTGRRWKVQMRKSFLQ